MRRPYALPFVALLLLMPIPLHALSSASVQELVIDYSTKDEAVVVPSELNPIIYKDFTYWFSYFTPQDSTRKNLVLIVRQTTPEAGVLETSEATLRTLYSLDFDMETLQMEKDKGVAFGDLKNIIDSLKFQLENTETMGLESIKRQSDEDFTKIEDALTEVKDAADDAQLTIQDGTDYLENFKISATTQEILLDDLGIVFDKYDESVRLFYVLAGRADKYQKAVAEKQADITESGIASELGKLGNLKVRDAVLRSYNASLSQQKKEIDLRFALKARSINDTISSFYFRKAKTEAENAYKTARENPLIESLLSPSNELALKDCRLSNAELKKNWGIIKTMMDPFTPHKTKEYEQVPAKIAQARSMAENLDRRLKSCISATPSPTPSPEGFDFRGIAAPLALIAVLALAAYYLNGYLKRKPEEGAE